MGRAINQENDITKLKGQVERIELALAKVIDVVDSMENKGQRTTHVDLVEDVSQEYDQVAFLNGDEKKSKSKKSNEKAKRTKKD